MMEKTNNSNVTVIIATINEEYGIGPTILELRSVLNDPKVLVIDGRSIDRTVEIAKSMDVDVILQTGKGKGQAIDQSIRQLNSDSRYVVFIDADLTYPAKFIPKMIEILEQNPDVGMVIGNRFNTELGFKGLIGDIFYLGNRLLANAQHLLNGIKLCDPLSGLRAIRLEILKSWKPKSKGFDVEAEMNFYVEHKGYKILETPIEYRSRVGEKKLKLRHGFVILKRIVAESLS